MQTEAAPRIKVLLLIVVETTQKADGTSVTRVEPDTKLEDLAVC